MKKMMLILMLFYVSFSCAEEIVDSKESLAESLLDVISKIKGTVQLAPCDAYLADSVLFSNIQGIPTDDYGNRQPLLAKLSTAEELLPSKKISEMFKTVLEFFKIGCLGSFLDPFSALAWSSCQPSSLQNPPEMAVESTSAHIHVNFKV